MAETLRLGIAGLGTVGAATAKMILRQGNTLFSRSGRPIEIAGLSARDRSRDRGFDVSGFTWFDDASELAASPDIDVFVELIGGEDGPAKAAVEVALSARKQVVTANKALLAAHGDALAALADASGVSIGFEAAVAGGIPAIKTLRESLSGNTVHRVFGILNGTCNYILTRMEREDRPFAEILKDAQDLGYAEADPTFDIDGHDTVHKLAILASLAFGTTIHAGETHCEGIRDISLSDIKAAKQLGYRIKLLGVAMRTEGGIEQRVHPTMVPADSPIAQVDGVLNAVACDTDALGQLMLVGSGAGGDATASAVVADICDIARGDRIPVLGRPLADVEPYRRARMRAHEGGYYLRLSVYDRPGGFAQIASRMAEAGISLESIVQKRDLIEGATAAEGEPQPVVLITHTTTEAAIRAAIQSIAADGAASGVPQCIRIETL